MTTRELATESAQPAVTLASRGGLATGLRSLTDNLLPFLILAVVWEVTVRLNVFPRVLMPSLADIGSTALRMALDGSLFHHLASSVLRLLVGFVIGALAGVGLGMVMGQSQKAERFFLPLLSALMPIPSLAWIPLFILWFGLGDTATIAVIIFSVVLPVAFNTWTGVKSANPVWVRAAESMGCRGRKLFFQVVLPGSLSMIFTGLRIGLSQGWRALVAGEMLSSPEWGMGFAIFDSRQFLATDVMLVMVMCIGLTGFLIVTVLFGFIEKRTVVRWGMLQEVGA
jgi:ABC-type nitrate/sulfonate/bicarbonate transport system permease component